MLDYFNTKPTLRDKIGTMLMFGFQGANLSDSGVKEIIGDIERYNLGGVVLYGRNIASPQQLKELTKALKEANKNLLIAVDQEGGKVERLSKAKGFESTPSAKKVEAGSLNDAYALYTKMAKMLKAHGINFNLAPCVDINTPPTTPTCPVIGGLERSYSDNPEIMTQFAGVFISAHTNQRVLTAVKHFPGHGLARGDTHKWLTDTTSSSKPGIELIPYKALTSPYTAVMTAHIVNKNLDSAGLPASLSKEIATGLLRRQLGFKGVTITDALEMGAIRKHYSLEETLINAVNAGNDILLFSRNPQASVTNPGEEVALWDTSPGNIINIIESAIKRGKIPESRIDESYNRILKYRSHVTDTWPAFSIFSSYAKPAGVCLGIGCGLTALIAGYSLITSVAIGTIIMIIDYQCSNALSKWLSQAVETRLSSHERAFS